MISLSTPMSVLLAGGGSAGHVSPLLALADAVVRRHPDARVTALGTREGLEARPSMLRRSLAVLPSRPRGAVSRRRSR